jgi:transposase InsO family protein
MPWKETRVEEERLKFIVACLDEESGWSMSELCDAFGVSRKSGYKWLQRYRAAGMEGLRDHVRAPLHHPNATPAELVDRLIAAREQHRFWGPRKLVARLKREAPDLEWPAPSTAGAILKRHGLVTPRRRRRSAVGAACTALSTPTYPNHVWGVDYKGWFRTGDGERCDPLTISDLFSRYLLECRRVQRPTTQCAWPVFERAFREYGLPDAIRSDNGTPYASCGLGGLSRLSVWWVKLGIQLERIVPGRPDQNGRHERMHRTLKGETAVPPCANAAAQQRSFNRFRTIFNTERPHEALNDTVPAQWYRPSVRAYPATVPEMQYPGPFEVRRVRTTGEIKWQGVCVYVSEALVGEPVGLDAVSDQHWKLYFGPIELGLLDNHTHKLLAYTRPTRRDLAAARGTRAVVENSSRPSGAFRSPQPQEGSPGKE